MKVQELRALLQDLDGDVDVMFRMSRGCCGDYLDLKLAYAESCKDPISKKFYMAEVRFEAVAGYKSCIQASKTERDDGLYWGHAYPRKEGVDL